MSKFSYAKTGQNQILLLETTRISEPSEPGAGSPHNQILASQLAQLQSGGQTIPTTLFLALPSEFANLPPALRERETKICFSKWQACKIVNLFLNKQSLV